MGKHSWSFFSWNRLYRRAFLCEHCVQFSPNTLCEDVEWCVAVFIKAQKVVQCNQLTYTYRVREGSTMHANYMGAVKRTKDYMDKVIPSVIRLVESLDKEFENKLMHRLLNECMSSLISTENYFVKHRDELRLNVLFPLLEKRYWPWLIFLNIDIRLFRFFWHLRGRL